MMTTLTERLEAVEAGSGEINVLVHAAAVNPDVLVEGGGYRGKYTHRFVKMADLIADGFPAADLEAYAPAYTTSLDAAMTLVPEGYVVKWIVFGDELCEAAVGKPDCEPDEILSSEAATPALALTAAALRAKGE